MPPTDHVSAFHSWYNAFLTRQKPAVHRALRLRRRDVHGLYDSVMHGHSAPTPPKGGRNI